MTNILQAIHNISQLQSFAIVEHYKSSIRIQQAGDALEYFIKDAFCGSFDKNVIFEKEELYIKHLSYSGKANSPPDFILKNGDAVEVKKIEQLKSNISLNSSYPKDKLFVSNSKLSKACRECENWIEKDIIYAIGIVSKNNLRSLWFVYGSVYAAEKEVYERIGSAISESLKYADGVEFSKTDELGKVKKNDPLGITDLRVRGMWGIGHPAKLFTQIENSENNLLNAVIPEEKYNSFPKQDIENLENNKLISVRKIAVKNPNNPVKLIPSIHISIAGEK